MNLLEIILLINGFLLAYFLMSGKLHNSTNIALSKKYTELGLLFILITVIVSTLFVLMKKTNILHNLSKTIAIFVLIVMIIFIFKSKKLEKENNT